MTWTDKTDSTLDYMIVYPTFEPERKREIKWAKRMNSFYGSVTEAAIKNAAKKGCKCLINITAEKDDGKISVSFSLRIRQRGRTLKFNCHNAVWENGVIVSVKKSDS